MERPLRLGAAALLALGALLVLHRILLSPDGMLLFQDRGAPWILVETEPTLKAQQYGDATAPLVEFSRSFELEREPRRALLALRAFGRFRVFVNGQALPRSEVGAAEASRRWKRFQSFDVAPQLVAGENRLRVEVRNLHGPALLSLRLEADGVVLRSDPDWSGRLADGLPRATHYASDQRPLSDAARGEAPFAMLLRKGPVLALLMALSAGGFALWQRRPPRLGPDTLVGAAGALVCLAWLVLFVAKFARLPLQVGFDASDHVAYLNRLLLEGDVPSARDGWAMYHPPLFYLASLALGRLASGLSLPAELGLKLVPFLAGLGQAWLALALCRALLPGDRAAWLLALLFAACLPMNLTAAAYLSNEGLHGFLSGAALVLACRMLLAGELGVRELAALSLVLGLALLTKFTAVITLACVGGALALALAARFHGRPPALAARLAALLLPLLAVSGWWYLRNWLEYGRPLVGNWSLDAPGLAWWSPPGFHTPAYYTSFGEALTRPYLAIGSVWDSLYTTLWGDGFLGGQILLAARHPLWSYDYMAAGYALALPATLLLGWGLLRAGREVWCDARSPRRGALALLLLFVAASGFAIVYATLGLPYYGQARALYALATTPALACGFALGARSLDGWLARRGATALRALLAAWLGALFGCFYLSFSA